MNGLKEFQKETVKAIIKRFYKNNQNRVLVADEVGLGKTLIAANVIKEIYDHYAHNKKSKIIYICSNQSIGAQNVRKLSNNNSDTPITDRLSTILLSLFKLEKKKEKLKIIALTPGTSFNLRSKTGTSYERAFIYYCIELLGIYSKDINEKISKYLSIEKKNYNYDLEWLKASIEKLGTAEFKEFLEKNIKEKEHLVHTIEKILRDNEEDEIKKGDIIKEIRLIFANIGISLLKPDLVILDEFQGYKELINENKNDETNLSKTLFASQDIKTLLLSATPFKLYLSNEENEIQNEEDCKEFLELMKFLLGEKDYKKFERIRKEYFNRLKTLNKDNIAIIKEKQKEYKSIMYKVILRTDRVSPLKQRENDSLKINGNDIQAYLDLNNIVKKINEPLKIEYVKSCPYLLTYMNKSNYQLKEEIEKYYNDDKKIKDISKYPLLWLDEKRINNYSYTESELKNANAKLNKVIENVFKDENIDKLLWIPPTICYYPLEYPFSNQSNISKTLIFSKHVMYRKMLSTLLSYLVERKTIYEAYHTKYFNGTKKRYPRPRLVFRSKKEEALNLTNFTLLYPSKELAKLFNKIDFVNNKNNQTKLIEKIKENLKKLTEKIKYDKTKEEDNRWYYLFPILIDNLNDKTAFNEWKETCNRIKIKEEENEETITQTSFNKHVENLDKMLDDYLQDKEILGGIPKDFEEIMTYIIIASPANCAYRIFNNIDLSFKLAYSFLSLFNNPESIAAVDSSIKRKEIYWKKVLEYCYNGNLQATLDEYYYMLLETNYLFGNDRKDEIVLDIMEKSLNIKTTTLNIDTLSNFKKRVTSNDEKLKNDYLTMRTHFAICFNENEKNETQSENESNRIGNVREAFNSPFRPFVLSTTSIGQEGLDFHFYCSRIIHYNLPSNPIDIEQREGRINRYKCFAIRKNIADFNPDLEYKSDIWIELFKSAEEKVKKENKGGLIPNWCLPNNELAIERIYLLFPQSSDTIKYNETMSILANYKLTIGQDQGKEILERILKNNNLSNEDKQELFINLSPYFNKKNKL